MAISPLKGANGIISIDILINGTLISNNILVVSIDIDQEVNQIASAEIHLLLPKSNRKGAFDLGKSGDFSPGQEIEIKAGYDGKNTALFQGLIVNQGIQISPDGSNEMIIKCCHEVVNMNVDQKNKSFQSLSDSEIISNICNENGFSAEVETTKEIHDQVLQYQSTDWDFIIRRAQANGMLVYTEGKKLIAKKPPLKGSPELVLTYGKDVIAFDANLGSHLKFKSNRKMSSAQRTAILGSASFNGSARVSLNHPIKLAGFGTPYSGNVLITGISHQIKDAKWETTTKFGLSQDWLQATSNNTYVVTEGVLMPILYGLQDELKFDYDNQDKVLSICTPAMNQIVLSDKDESIVLQDQHGNKIEMNADGITLSSIKDIVLDAHEDIEVEADQELKLEGTEEIELSSAKNIVLDASREVEIKAAQDLVLKSTGRDVLIEGLNVEAKANLTFSAEGSASAKLESPGQTTVNGAMVMIN